MDETLFEDVGCWLRDSENPKDFWLQALDSDLDECKHNNRHRHKIVNTMDAVRKIKKFVHSLNGHHCDCDSCPLAVGKQNDFMHCKSWEGKSGEIYSLSTCVWDWVDWRWTIGTPYERKKWKKYHASQKKGTDKY